jgi:hypothetical protein
MYSERRLEQDGTEQIHGAWSQAPGRTNETGEREIRVIGAYRREKRHSIDDNARM